MLQVSSYAYYVSTTVLNFEDESSGSEEESSDVEDSPQQVEYCDGDSELALFSRSETGYPFYSMPACRGC